MNQTGFLGAWNLFAALVFKNTLHEIKIEYFFHLYFEIPFQDMPALFVIMEKMKWDYLDIVLRAGMDINDGSLNRLFDNGEFTFSWILLQWKAVFEF